MASPKIVGLEAEYGVLRGMRNDDRQLQRAARVLARSVARVGSIDGLVGNPLAWITDAALINGGRVYLDGAEPSSQGWLEIATPECRDALSALKYQLASDALATMAADADALEQEHPGSFDHRMRLYRKSADIYGNTRGMHENYSIPYSDRRGFAEEIAYGFACPRLLIAGAGAPPMPDSRGAMTISARPTMNEPFAIYKGSRLQISAGEHKRCHVSQFLEIGAMQFVLAMHEDDVPLYDLMLRDDPWKVYPRIATDLSLNETHGLESGERVTALDLLEEYRDRAVGWAARHGFDAVGGERVGRLVLEWWGKVVDALRTDRTKLVGVLDWVTKEHLFATECERREVAIDSMEIQMVDLLYHDLRPQSSRFARMERRGMIEPLVPTPDVARAMQEPPADTRAWTRTIALTERAWAGISNEYFDWEQFTPEPWGGTRAAYSTERVQLANGWIDPVEKTALAAEASFFEDRPGSNGYRALENFLWSDAVRTGSVPPARLVPTVAPTVKRVERDAEIMVNDSLVPLAKSCRVLRLLRSLDDWSDGAFGRGEELARRVRDVARRELQTGMASATDVHDVLADALPESDTAALTWFMDARAVADRAGNSRLVLRVFDTLGSSRFGLRLGVEHHHTMGPTKER